MARLIFEKSMESEYGKEYADRIDRQKEMVWSLLRNYGKIMICNENDKLYKVYRLKTLSNLLGIEYVICRLVEQDETDKEYGSTYIKPFELFRDYNPYQFNDDIRNNKLYNVRNKNNFTRQLNRENKVGKE